MQIQICDYLSDRGWEASREKRVNFLDGEEVVKDHLRYIDVDVFAIKNGITYVAEIGQTNCKQRMEVLDEFFDIVSHITLDRLEYRNLNRGKWDKIKYAAVELDRPIFGDRPHRIKLER